MTKNTLVVWLMLAGLGAGASVAHAQQAGDGCALLQAAEIQALAGANKVDAGKPSTDVLGSRSCQYEWGTGVTVQAGRTYLSVNATPLSKAYPGMDVSVVKQGLLTTAAMGAPKSGVVPGVGDAAMYDASVPNRLTMTALAKGHVLIVGLQSTGANAKKDQVIALMKAAAGRL
jgi:hypothetical protein